MPDTAAIRKITQGSNGILRTEFVICEPRGFLIPTGADGSAVAPVVLDANSRVIAIVCEDATGIDAATNMSARVAWDNQLSSSLVPLYEQDDPSTQWSRGAIPATGQFGFILTHAFRARQIRLVLSVVTTAPVMFNIYGLDGVI